jgi:uncharacterized protein YjbI with pentapeptide repeats
MKRSVSVSRVVSHPSTLAVFSGFLGALIGFLSGATLTEAAFISANLQGADLSGATLTWAVLDEADLRAAKVTEEQLQTVVSGKNVKREP